MNKFNYAIQDSLKRSVYCKLSELNNTYWNKSNKLDKSDKDIQVIFINSDTNKDKDDNQLTIGIEFIGDITITMNHKKVKDYEEKGIIAYYISKKLFGRRGNGDELGRIIYEIIQLSVNNNDSNNKLAIYVPCTKDIRSWWSNFYLWGDYHVGIQLKKAFERFNFSVILVMMPYWDSKVYEDYDIKLVLRGNSDYIPSKSINLLWNLYDPETLTEEYCSLFDHVFVCSEYHKSKLKCKNVSVLMQCVDSHNLNNKYGNDNRFIFVGNKRRGDRNGVLWAKGNKMDLELYGVGWKDSKVLNSDEVKKIYGGNIVLNDHLETMREYGYISNKCFDIVANGGKLLCDNVKGIKDVFKDYVTIYKDSKDLYVKYREMVKTKSESIKINKEWVKKHSYDNAVKVIINHIKAIQ